MPEQFTLPNGKRGTISTWDNTDAPRSSPIKYTISWDAADEKKPSSLTLVLGEMTPRFSIRNPETLINDALAESLTNTYNSTLTAIAVDFASDRGPYIGSPPREVKSFLIDEVISENWETLYGKTHPKTKFNPGSEPD